MDRAAHNPLSDAERPPAASFVIKGVTRSGKVFRPSDWAERLSGVMSSFRPGAVGAGLGAHLQYSPYVQPLLGGDVKSVRVDGRLDTISPMAYRFVKNFARDNDLQIEDPEPPAGAQTSGTPASGTQD